MAEIPNNMVKLGNSGEADGTSHANNGDYFVLPKFTTHPADLVSAGLVVLSTVGELADLLPAKYAGVVMGLYVFIKLFLRYSGREALVQQGNAAALELRQDIGIISAKKATKP